MPSNLDLVRSICAAWERGECNSVEWAHPQIEFVVMDGPSPGSWTGVAGMREWRDDFLSAWEGYRLKADGHRELDDERVLVFSSRSGRGKSSGLEIGQLGSAGATLFHVRDGK